MGSGSDPRCTCPPSKPGIAEKNIRPPQSGMKAPPSRIDGSQRVVAATLWLQARESNRSSWLCTMRLTSCPASVVELRSSALRREGDRFGDLI